MVRKMILFDLDGTLLTSDGIVSSITATAINNCKLKGYYIGIITARPRFKTNICLLENLPYDFIAFYNGAEIYAENHIIESNLLPYKQSAIMIQKLNMDFPNIIIDVHQEPCFYSSICSDICNMKLGDRKMCTINELPKHDIQRIRLKSESIMSISLQKYMISESTFYYTVSGDAIIVQKNANKGYATQAASNFFEIPLNQIIAFGDDVNDIDMIKIVGIGIAMGNACISLKKIAGYITETNDNNGVAVWINRHLI